MPGDVNPLQQYVAEEIATDHADGLLSRREALRRLGLLGVSLSSASALLAACAGDNEVTAPPVTSTPPSPSPTAATGTEAITFAGPEGRTLQGAFAAAATARGGVVVIHENRGLTDHIRTVAARFAASGYSALAVDLLSAEGGTGKFTDSAQATAALTAAPEARLIADAKAAIGEIQRRVPGTKAAMVGFCFGGGMVWRVLNSGDTRLAAAVPFYGPSPDNPNFSGSKQAAVLGIYAEQDDRVNASRDTTRAALQKAGNKHEIVTYPGVGHAFFNDTGQRYNADAATKAYAKVLSWFGTHLG